MTSKALTSDLRCVVLIGGVEIWIEAAKLSRLQHLMETQKHLELEGSIIAVSQIAGVFRPEHMEEQKRLKEGQWRCMKGNAWHDRGEKCHCEPVHIREIREKLQKLRQACSKCKGSGYLSMDVKVGHKGPTTLLCTCSAKEQRELDRAKGYN